MARFDLTLFVSPDSSGKALAQLYRALESLPYTDYKLVIVDVLQEPQAAQKAGVAAAPALLYRSQGGDVLITELADRDAVRRGLGLEELAPVPDESL